MDFRVGGAYRICMRGFGNDHWVHGVYKEIVEHEQIVFSGTFKHEGNEILTTVTFANHEGKTMLTVRQSFSLETDSTRGAHQVGAKPCNVSTNIWLAPDEIRYLQRKE